MTQRVRLAARMLGRGRNPLLRQVDRVEAAIMIGLVVGSLAAAPLVAIYAGRLADAQGLREQRAQQGWRQEPAILQQSASAGEIGQDGGDTSWVKATWPSPSGGHRSGKLAMPLNATKGEVVRVWVTQTGALTRPRLTTTDLRDRIAFAVLTAIAGVAALELLIAVAVRAAMSRSRMARWESAWRAAGPKWSQLR